MMLISAMCMLLLFKVGFTVYSNKEIEGHPGGFLPDCPGFMKEAIITEKSLKLLTVSVVRKTSSINIIHNKYNYYQMEELAKDPYFDVKKKTVIYLGGFLDSPNFGTTYPITVAYKDLGYNVLIVDTNHFTAMEYPRAARFSHAVGKYIAKMLVQLKSKGLEPKNIELIGLSLGGQTVSFVAKHYKNITNMKVSRITGLDPAGGCFRNLGHKDRIDKSDADFVEIIATNIEGYGLAAPVGHINYYVNGGEFQPGGIYWLECELFCSHVRSYLLWYSALRNPNSFIAIQCDSVQQARNKTCFDRTPMVTNIMGLNADKSKGGIFYLGTSNTYPFYLGKKGLKKENEYYTYITKAINEQDVIKI